MLLTKLQDAWTGIQYARRILHVDRIILEDNFVTVIFWIANAMRSPPLHPIIRDIIFMLHDYPTIFFCHVLKKTNSVMN